MKRFNMTDLSGGSIARTKLRSPEDVNPHHDDKNTKYNQTGNSDSPACSSSKAPSRPVLKASPRFARAPTRRRRPVPTRPFYSPANQLRLISFYSYTRIA